MNAFNKVITVALLASACVSAVFAQENEEPKELVITQVETTALPKPYMNLTIPVGVSVPAEIKKGTQAQVENNILCPQDFENNSKLSFALAGSTESADTTFFVDLVKSADGLSYRLTFFVDDRIYFQGGTNVTVELPTLVYEGAEYEGLKYQWTIESPYTIAQNTNASAIASEVVNRAVVVKAPYCLTVDAELNVRQLIVEGGNDNEGFAAGVHINEGGILNVSDTAYFLCPRYSNRHLAYLINRGGYTAGGTVFTKTADFRINVPFAKLYGESPEKNIEDWLRYYVPDIHVSVPASALSSVYTFVRDDDGLLDSRNKMFYNDNAIRQYPFGSLANKALFLSKGISTAGTFDFSETRPTNLYIHSKCKLEESLAFRVKVSGDIEMNDAEEYSHDLSIWYPEEYNINHETFLYPNNPYPAPIDFRSLADADTNVVKYVRSMHVNDERGMHTGYCYNMQTGLTTFDGPMYFGYLVPHLSPANLNVVKAQNDSSGRVIPFLPKLKVSKDNVISYEDAEKKYEGRDLTNGLPYVRFYVDDPNLPKRKGTRSVFVAYFLPMQDENGPDMLEILDETNSDFDATPSNKYENLLWTTTFPYEASVGDMADSPSYPLIGAIDRCPNVPSYIKGFEKPEDVGTVVNVIGKVTVILHPNQKEYEVGVLDYGNLGDMSVTLGNLVVNSHVSQDILVDTVKVEKDLFGKLIYYNVRFDRLSLSSRMQEPKQEESGNPDLPENPEQPENPENPDQPVDSNAENQVLGNYRLYKELGKIRVVATVPCSVVLYNSNGVRVVASSESSNNHSFSVSKGIYFVTINTMGVSTTKKILVD